MNSYSLLLEMLYLQVTKSVSRLLMAASFACNMIIYCITSPLFRKALWSYMTGLFICTRVTRANGRDGVRSVSSITTSTRISMVGGDHREENIPLKIRPVKFNQKHSRNGRTSPKKDSDLYS